MRKKTKKRTVQIASLGLKEQQRIKIVLTARACDKLILLHTKDNADEARALLDEIGKTSIEQPEAVEVEPWDYTNVLAKTMEQAIKHKACRLSFNPSLGTRVMSVALFWAAMFTESPIHMVEERDGNPVDVITIHTIGRKKITGPKRRIMKALVLAGKDGVGKWKDLKPLLEDNLGVKADSPHISRHTKRLREWGYVEVDDTGRKRITDLGKAVLEASEYWR